MDRTRIGELRGCGVEKAGWEARGKWSALGIVWRKHKTNVGGQGMGYLYAIPVTAKTVQGKAVFVKEQ